MNEIMTEKKWVDKDDYASKGVGNTALGLSIAALGTQLLGGNLGNLLGVSQVTTMYHLKKVRLDFTKISETLKMRYLRNTTQIHLLSTKDKGMTMMLLRHRLMKSKPNLQLMQQHSSGKTKAFTMQLILKQNADAATMVRL